jgi:hypothetical protein
VNGGEGTAVHRSGRGIPEDLVCAEPRRAVFDERQPYAVAQADVPFELFQLLDAAGFYAVAVADVLTLILILTLYRRAWNRRLL